MANSRRRFLRMLLLGTSVVTVPALVRGSMAGPPEISGRLHGELASNKAALPAQEATSASPPAATAAPTALPPTAIAAPTAVAADIASAPSRRTFAWLRMYDLPQIPDSSRSFGEHAATFDVAMPLNGGKLLGDGTWLQEGTKIGAAWPRSLPKLARERGQLYMPSVGNDRDGTLVVLNDAGLQDRAAAELVALAKGRRSDGPWDGVVLDIEGIDFAYRRQMSQFLDRLARAIKGAGLLFGVSVGGPTQAPRAKPDEEDAFDLAVVAQVADYVDLRCYDYWAPAPRSIGPYWWIKVSIEFVLGKGVSADKLTVGFANFSRYWPDSRSGLSNELTYEQAMVIAQTAGAQVEWVESNRNGLVREKYAQIGNGHVWIRDADVYQAALLLLDEYNVMGTSMFAPGMGDPRDFAIMAQWRQGGG